MIPDTELGICGNGMDMKPFKLSDNRTIGEEVYHFSIENIKYGPTDQYQFSEDCTSPTEIDGTIQKFECKS